MAVVGLAEVLAQHGLGAAVVRHPSPTRSHYDTAWTISLAFHTVIAALVFISAPWAAGFFQRPVIEPIVRALSLRPLLLGLTNIGVVNFQRELNFRKDLVFNVSARLLGFFLTIAAAFVFRDYRALVVGAVTRSALLTGLSYIMHPYRPRLSLAAARELIHFSGWMILNAVGKKLILGIDRIIIGRIATPAITGFYATAQDIARIFTQESAVAINRALMPSAAKIQHDPQRMRRVQIKAANAYSLIATSFGVGICATSNDFVAVVLGSQWIEVTPYLEILALAATGFALSEFVAPLCIAMNRVRAVAILRVSQALVLIGVLNAAAKLGDALTIAVARLSLSIVFAPLAVLVLTSGSVRESLSVCFAIARPIVAGVFMFLAIRAVHIEDLLPAILTLTIDVSFGALVFGTCVYLIWWLCGKPIGAEEELLNRISKILRLRRSPNTDAKN